MRQWKPGTKRKSEQTPFQTTPVPCLPSSELQSNTKRLESFVNLNINKMDTNPIYDTTDDGGNGEISTKVNKVRSRAPSTPNVFYTPWIYVMIICNPLPRIDGTQMSTSSMYHFWLRWQEQFLGTNRWNRASHIYRTGTCKVALACLRQIPVVLRTYTSCHVKRISIGTLLGRIVL